MTDPHPFAPAGQEPAAPARGATPACDGAAQHCFHLATLTHEGRFWDAFVEFVDEPSRPESQARLCFVPADRAGPEAPARTAVIIIEPTAEEALAQARSLPQRQVAAMLRSAI